MRAYLIFIGNVLLVALNTLTTEFHHISGFKYFDSYEHYIGFDSLQVLTGP